MRKRRLAGPANIRKETLMSEIVVINHLTLDGVMQAPGRPDEDTRGGFTHGGWAAPFSDEVSHAEMGKRMANTGALLFGRRTYEDFYSVWPNRGDNPYTAALNAARKYVASTTLREPLPWVNSTLLPGDAADAIAKLKAESEKDFVIMGSGVLIQSLMRRQLIDRYVLTIQPLVLGSGRRLFPDDGAFATLRLVDSKPTTKGGLIVVYERNK
jgi:dihydrofolate reductase